MLLIEEEYKNSDLILDMILRVHEVLTQDTLDESSNEEALRKTGDQVHVIDDEGVIYYTAPDAQFILPELQKIN